MLGAGAMGWRRQMVWVGRWEGGSGWGTRIHLWQIHVDVWQNQYNIVSNKPPIKINKFVFFKKTYWTLSVRKTIQHSPCISCSWTLKMISINKIDKTLDWPIRRED